MENCHCTLYPTTHGWYMEMAKREGGGLSDSCAYGPSNSLAEMSLFWSYVKGYVGVPVVLREMRDVPLFSPDGSLVVPVELDHRSGWECAFGAPMSRFLTSKDDVQNYTVYDTASDLGFSIHCVNRPNPRRVSSFYGGFAWRKSDLPVAFEPRLAPKTGPDWEALVRDALSLAVGAGWEYDPVLIPGLPQQPFSLAEMKALLP